MRKPLTDRQRRVLELVAERLESDGAAPSLVEIGRALGGVSPTAALAHVVALERKGYLRRDRHLPRSLRLIAPPATDEAPGVYQLPIKGAIAAGAPLEVFESHWEHVAVEASLAGAPTNYVLRVRGSSMIDDGILD